MNSIAEVWHMGLSIKKALALDRVRFVERRTASYSQALIASLPREPFAKALFTPSLHMCEAYFPFP